jgi:hypothetical protein
MSFYLQGGGNEDKRWRGFNEVGFLRWGFLDFSDVCELEIRDF